MTRSGLRMGKDECYLINPFVSYKHTINIYIYIIIYIIYFLFGFHIEFSTSLFVAIVKLIVVFCYIDYSLPPNITYQKNKLRMFRFPDTSM